MKKTFLATILACCSLALAAQDSIRVNYQGDRPTIKDFAQSYLFAPLEDYEEEAMWVDEATNAMKDAWTRRGKSQKLEEGQSLMIDQRNGFVVFESKYEEDLLRMEMCYWNESDGKHKVFAINTSSFHNGIYTSPGQYDGLTFYRYDNATRKMTPEYEMGFEVEYQTEDGAWVTYALPRSGKDITVTYWYENGTTKQRPLKWNGSKFSF